MLLGQYFVRNPEGMFPYAPAAWSEIRIIANEVRVLTPALLGGKPVPESISTPSATVAMDEPECAHVTPVGSAAAEVTVVKAWEDRDRTVVVIAANTVNADGPTVSVVFKVNAPTNSDGGSHLHLSETKFLESLGSWSALTGHVTMRLHRRTAGCFAKRILQNRACYVYV